MHTNVYYEELDFRFAPIGRSACGAEDSYLRHDVWAIKLGGVLRDLSVPLMDSTPTISRFDFLRWPARTPMATTCPCEPGMQC
jgi:hypothetical protein